MKNMMARLIFLILFSGILVFTNANAQANLVESLPNSDAVVLINANQLFNEAIPQILADNPKKLTEANAEIDKIKARTGIDLRQFDEIAIGLRSVAGEKGKVNVEALILASGKYDSQALISIIKLLVRNYREEKIKDTVAYVFSIKDLQEKNKSSNRQSIIEKGIDIATGFLPEEVAVCVLDKGTLALGSLPMIKELLTTTPRLKTEIVNLLSQRPNAIIRFGAEIPSNISPLFGNLGDEELERTLSSLRQLFGWVDWTKRSAQLSVNVRTDKPENAQKLEELLGILQILANSFLGGLSEGDKKIYAKVVNDIKISRNKNLLSLNLEIPREDLSSLIR